MRRAVLQEMINEVDRVITKVEDFEWHKQENKPSAFFHKVHQTYLGMYEEGPDKYAAVIRAPSQTNQHSLRPITPRKARYVEMES